MAEDIGSSDHPRTTQKALCGIGSSTLLPRGYSTVTVRSWGVAAILQTGVGTMNLVGLARWAGRSKWDRHLPCLERNPWRQAAAFALLRRARGSLSHVPSATLGALGRSFPSNGV